MELRDVSIVPAGTDSLGHANPTLKCGATFFVSLAGRVFRQNPRHGRHALHG
jgi:hypothetical protein